MIICTNCGNHNQNEDEFCGSCGKFLEWVGQKVEDPPKPEVIEEEAEPDDVRVGLIDRVKAAVGIEGAAGTGAGDGGATTATVEEAPPQPTAEDLERERIAREDQEARARLAAEDAAERERQAADAAAAAERERMAAEAAAAAAAASQAAAEEQARRAAEEERRREWEAAERERQAADAAAAAERERVAAEAAAAAALAAAAAEAEERERLEREAREAADAAERERLAAEAEAAAAAAAREAQEQARREAEEAAAKARAEEEARRAAEAEEVRRKAEEERARREAEQRAEAARRAAALLAQPKAPAAPPPSDVAAPSTTASTAAAPPAAAPSAPPKAPPRPAATPAQPAAAVTPDGSAAARASIAPSQEPAKPKAPPKPATQIKVDEGPKAGDLICDSCGTGNDPTRKFCRKCGTSLAKAEPVKKLPWWKRIFGGRKKQPKASKGAKGKGAKGKGGAVKGARQASFKAEMAMARLRNGMLLLAALGIGGMMLLPSPRAAVMNGVRNGIDKARDTLFPSFSPERPVAITASSEAPGHPAAQAADLAVNTYWAEGAEGDGIGQTVSFTFPRPFELGKILITPGAIDTNAPDAFLKNPRPRVIHLVFDNGGSTDLTLKDEIGKAQTFTVKGAKGITKVDISITEVHPGSGGQDTAIAEVEFRSKG